MAGQAQDHQNIISNHSSSSSSHGSSSSTEPVRSRWTPKPEQILILESIFNSGMVNPPKDETVRIRKMLEKFGAVGDANVFYWFQNRRSRSRRRQRQLQAAGLPVTTAAAAAAVRDPSMSMNSLQGQAITVAPPLPPHGEGISGGGFQYSSSGSLGFGICNNSPNYFFGPPSFSSFLLGPSCSSPCSSSTSSSSSSSSSSSGGVCENNNGVECLFTMSGQMVYQDHHQQHTSNITSMLCPSDQNSSFHYQQGTITVFINGVPTEVPRGPIDMKSMFGEDLVLVHSSGVPLPINDFGFLMQSLQHGEAYFLDFQLTLERHASITIAELWAVRENLHLSSVYKFKKILVESDSQTIEYLMRNGAKQQAKEFNTSMEKVIW